ncbi:MAG: cobalt ECF transporter T component CbiQ [Dehalococcoidia bacterium]
MSALHSVAQLDRFIAGNSLIHRADPVAKFVATLGFIVVVATVPLGGWAAFALLYAVVWTAVLVSGAGSMRILRRSLVVLPFILLPLPSLFTKAGAAWFQVDLGLFTLTATHEGAALVASIMLKSWASVTAAALYATTTPFVTTLETLRTLRAPSVLVSIIALMYRYLFLLVEETERLLRARRARCASPAGGATAVRRPGGGIRWRAGVAGGMAGSLFVRTYERSERVYQAMLARGFDGAARPKGHGLHRLSPRAVLGVVAALALLGAAAQVIA